MGNSNLDFKSGMQGKNFKEKPHKNINEIFNFQNQ